MVFLDLRQRMDDGENSGAVEWDLGRESGHESEPRIKQDMWVEKWDQNKTLAWNEKKKINRMYKKAGKFM